MRYAFGPFRLEPAERRLLREGRSVPLTPKAFDTLCVLVARQGNDVSLLPFNQPALDLSEFAVSGRDQAWFDVFAWSGRELL